MAESNDQVSDYVRDQIARMRAQREDFEHTMRDLKPASPMAFVWGALTTLAVATGIIAWTHLSH